MLQSRMSRFSYNSMLGVFVVFLGPTMLILGVCLISSTVPTEDQILVPETLLKKRKSQEKAREEKSAEQQKKKKVSAL